MKKTNAILIAAMVCMMTSVCWGQSYWKRTYGMESRGSASAITPSRDGNFIVVGHKYNFSGGVIGEGYILKITPFGDTLWTKTYRNNVIDSWASAITPTADGNFIVAGCIESTVVGMDNVYLMKITQNGDTLWTKTYRNNVIDSWASAITPTADGNFIVAGYIDSPDGRRNVYLMKITANGDSLWTKTYGVSGLDYANAIALMPDGNFIITASGWAGGYLLEIKSNGDTLWTKTYGVSGFDYANAITPTPDGNFIIAGENDYYDVYLLKIKPNGETVWTKTFGIAGYSGASCIMPTPDGNFIIAGSNEDYDIYILKIKSNGDSLWTKTYKDSGDEYASTITPTSDGNCILIGYIENIFSGGGSILLLSIINDRYAYKDSLFTFKIPVSGDSLSHGYTPLKVPSGMIVSAGGTISWTPQTASVYMDHAEFLVSDDFGNKDTLTFNIFVNSSYHPTAIKPLSRPIVSKNQAFSIMQTSSSQIKFTLPASTSDIDIFDINGRCVQRIKPVGAQAIWNGLSTTGSPVSSGRYFAKIKEGKAIRMGQFTIIR